MSDQLKKVYDDLDFASDRLSTQARTISLSVLAFCWLALSSAKDAPAVMALVSREAWLVLAILCIAVLLVDFLQYLFGYMKSQQVREAAEAAESEEPVAYVQDWLYRAREICFAAKVLLALGAAVGLVLALGSVLVA